MNITELELLLDEIECPPYTVTIGDLGDGFYVQVCRISKCVDTGVLRIGSGAKLYVSRHSARGEVVQKVLGGMLAFAEHEVRESFTWEGKRIFGPHIDIDALWTIADDRESRQDTRPTTQSKP